MKQFISIANALEESGEYGAALVSLDQARVQAASHPVMHGFYDGAFKRLCDRIDGNIVMENLNVIPVYIGENTPEKYDFESEDSTDSMPRAVVSITTISSRLDRIERTIDSILAQDHPAFCINLFISDTPYLVDEGINLEDERLSELAAKGINIYSCSNIGPYRKQYPVISMLMDAGASAETPIVTMDDDVIYPPDTLRRLVSGLFETDCVTSFRGRSMTIDERGLLPYNTFEVPRHKISMRNIGTGKNGIAYKLKYFPKSPAYYIGPVIAPTADDLWCKWVTSIYCIPTYILVPEAAYKPELDFEETEPEDKVGLFHKYNARGSNDDCMQSLELFFSNAMTGLAPILRDNP